MKKIKLYEIGMRCPKCVSLMEEPNHIEWIDNIPHALLECKKCGIQALISFNDSDGDYIDLEEELKEVN